MIQNRLLINWRHHNRLQKLIIALLACTAILTGYYALSQPDVAVQLTVEMSSSTPATAQLFYDVGHGYNETDSKTVAVAATPVNSFNKLTFALPRKTIFHLRLDPALTEGTFIFRQVSLRDQHGVLLTFTPVDLTSFNQIQTKSAGINQSRFVTIAGANDPGIVLTLHKPFSDQPVSTLLLCRFVLIGDSVFLSAAVLLYVTRRQLFRLWLYLCTLFQRADSKLEVLALFISDPQCIQFDSLSIWFYLGCLSCFVAGTVFDLNGSSLGIYGTKYHFGATETPIVGEPRPVRVDEWSFETPIILNQVLREKPFRIGQSYPGNHRVALIANAPVLHFTTIFRPQFWSFFVLPLDYAFAAYWQFKALILLTGIFTFLLLISRCSFWSAAGALWFFVSPCTQWTYSWPSALPEMTGLICWTVVLGCFLIVAKSPVKLYIAAVAFASCAINFAMCAYLPHLIPLLWLGLFCFASWSVARWRTIIETEFVIRRGLAVAIAVMLIGLTGFDLYRELRVAIVRIGETSYPGSRYYSGGTFTLKALASHFFNWTETDVRSPAIFPNICESSGFLWLAPVTLLLMGRLSLSKLQRSALAALWAFSLIVLSWLILPISSQSGRLLALDRTGYTRLLPALGLANVAIVAVSMSATRLPQIIGGWRSHFNTAGQVIGIVLVTFSALCLTNEALAGYLSWGELSLITCATASFVVLLVQGRRVILAFALIVPQAIVFGAANPTQRGLDVLTRSSLYSFVRSHKELLKGRWFVYSDQRFVSGFLEATGCNVYTGLTYIPDVDNFGVFEAAGLSHEALNRDAEVVAEPLPPNTKAVVEAPVPYRMVWHASPTDPVLKAIGIKYFAFDQKPSEITAATLAPLANQPIGGVWLYKRK